MVVKFIIYSLLIFILAGCSNNMRRFKAELVEHTALESQNNIQENRQNDYLATVLRLYNSQLYDSALIIINDIYPSHQHDWKLNYYFGKTESKKGNFVKSETYLLKSLRLVGDEKKDRADIYIALAEHYEIQSQLGKAKQHYLTALNLDPLSQTASESLKRLGEYTQNSQ
jgi:tetratricopeptide (TPR) repeat protein